MSDVVAEACLRLLIATFAGAAIGLNRDLHGKPVGVRTLGLVALGAALATLSSTTHGKLNFEEDAVSRVIQGILTGVGFIGAGVILHDRSRMKVYGLTTAATVWIAAMLGVASGLGAWPIALAGGLLTLFLLMFGGALERLSHRLLGRNERGGDGETSVGPGGDTG